MATNFPDLSGNNRAGVDLTTPVAEEVQDDVAAAAIEDVETAVTGATAAINDIDPRIGATDDAAAGSDTATASLIALTKRSLQRITTAIGHIDGIEAAVTNSLNVPLAAPTYSASGAGYTAYATPTDMLSIFGSATKTVLVTNMSVWIQQTTPAGQVLDFLKRSTANTGGTPTTPGIMAYDSTQAAATAVVTLYGSAPTTGTLVGGRTLISAAAGTGLAGNSAGLNGVNNAWPYALLINDTRRPFVLRGTGEGVVCNYKGAALPAGFTMTWFVEWIEF